MCEASPLDMGSAVVLRAVAPRSAPLSAPLSTPLSMHLYGCWRGHASQRALLQAHSEQGKAGVQADEKDTGTVMHCWHHRRFLECTIRAATRLCKPRRSTRRSWSAKFANSHCSKDGNAGAQATKAWHEEAWHDRRGRPGAAGLRRWAWRSTARAWRVASQKSEHRYAETVCLSLFVQCLLRGSATPILLE